MKKRTPLREPLSRDRIVDEALRQIESDGLEAFSTRRLGTALGVEAMSLYHHFPSKGHLLDAVCDRLMTMVTIPPREAGDWEMRLRESILSYRAVARAHPRAFLLMATRRFNTPGALWVLDRLLEIFADAGFDPQMRARAFRILGYYLNGALLSEVTILAQVPDPTGSRIDAGEIGEELPYLYASGRYLGPEWLDATYEAGIEILFDAIRDRAGDGSSTP